MKLLMVSRWLWEEYRRNNGAPGFFGELAEAIGGQGIDLTILSQADDAGITPEPRPIRGLKLHVFSREKRQGNFWLSDKALKSWSGYRKAATDAACIRRFVEQHGPFDAVIAQCEEPDGLACAWAARTGAFPPIVTFVHDLRYAIGQKDVRFIRKSSLGFVFKKSARVVANSDQTALWLQREYGVPESKIGRCRIHLTSPFLDAAAKSKDAVSPTEKRILFLGALNRKKAPDVFLCAAALIALKVPDWNFVIVGGETAEDAPFRAEVKKLASDPQLSGRLEILGRLNSSEVMSEIRRAHVVVCPSRIETFSRTTIEALALGRPVIVTSTTGAATWVERTGAGSVIPPDDAEALAQAMIEWTAKVVPQGGSALVTSELTLAQAAQDWLREVRRAIEPIPPASSRPHP